MTSIPTHDQENGTQQGRISIRPREYELAPEIRPGSAPRPVVPTYKYVPKYFAKVENGKARIYRNSGVYVRSVGHDAGLAWVLKGDIVRVINETLQSNYYDIDTGREIMYEDSPMEPPSIPREKMVGVFGYIKSQEIQYH